MFLSSGEASGDHYGAQIIHALRASLPNATFTGLGGAEMAQAGQTRIVKAEDVAHMGITEVILHAPYIYSQYRKLVASIRSHPPAAAILIDFPDVNFRLAKHLKSLGIPVIWFVSPQLWAWKRRRLRWVQQRVTRMLTIFPFEEQFYKNRKVQAEFVGHPLAELPLPTITREAYAAHNNLDPNKPWIALLPGSRWREIESNLPTMVEMACRHPRDVEYILPVASTIDRPRLADFTAGWISHYPGSDPTLTLPYIHLVSDAREALHHARASVVASGTATVQAALIGNPFLVVYKVSPITFKLAKSLVWYPPEVWPTEEGTDRNGNLPIAMPNLIAGRRIVPELLQERFNPDALSEALTPLLRDTPTRQRQLEDLAALRQCLTTQGPTPIVRVRDAVLSVLPPSVN
ncbi:lipid-A-disaccharide synthase [Granulicella tundricola]|uniref:lipid-A-disaccharide synthase n=1 Tax=Granulicella tundricola TaxID=940615 RepID=UPI001E358BED|nr:lipid-A-disaccharide synthase [Granulicella tundricola]